MTSWTPEQVEQLIHLVKVEKLSSYQIAERIHLSRNAIIGRIHRMARKDPTLMLAGSGKYGAPAKPRALNPLKPRPKRVKSRHTLTVKAEVTQVPIVRWTPPKTKLKTVTILNREPWMCKYPTGHDEVMLFCGKPRKDWSHGSTDETGSPYCAKHHMICYSPAPHSAKPRPRPHYAK